ncbi:uncharacterized protein LOC102804724 [Saccoglossus kowalevskii]|uniref:Uncharacterized protein LOC102804724 n=1 Tax=Saccoglossus kowalevskii TaxID=10224 RepID=A0ABM0MSY3_SACKO|nr:PREDICTED: uncharacterized protein LOC102804724 [Saccoglossus kowalevskii]
MADVLGVYSLFVALSLLFFYNNASNAQEGCNMSDVCRGSEHCDYSFSLPVSDGHRCREIDTAIRELSPNNDALLLLVQTMAEKLERAEALFVDHLGKVDELEAGKRQLQQLLSDKLDEIEELRVVNERCDTDRQRVQHSLEICEDEQQLTGCQHDETGNLGPNETTIAFNGSSIVTYEGGSIPELTELTWCFWMKTSLEIDYNEKTVLVHYQNEDVIELSTRQKCYAKTLYIDSIGHSRYRGGGGAALFRRIHRDGLWHHVCMAWVGAIGKGRRWVYVDGVGTIIGDGHVERMFGGGKLYLGYSPTVERGLASMYVGEMALFNMWDVKLDDAVIADMAQQCYNIVEGNIVPWSAFFGDGANMENIQQNKSDFCANDECDVNSCLTDGVCILPARGQCQCPNRDEESVCSLASNKLTFTSSVAELAVNSDLSDVSFSALTICMWLKTSYWYDTTIFQLTTRQSTLANDIQRIGFTNFKLLVDTFGGAEYEWYSYLITDPSKVTDNAWHHICISGTLATSPTLFRIYHEGLMITRPRFNSDLTLSGVESVSLGRFTGELFEFNMWNRELSEQEPEIYMMSRRCGEYVTAGPILQWSFLYEEAKNTDGVSSQTADVCTLIGQ